MSDKVLRGGGRNPRKFTEAEIAKMRELRSQHRLTLDAISRRFRCSKATVRKYCGKVL
jgi:DNA invertase Pin-like site-specific DNA recombinase